RVILAKHPEHIAVLYRSVLDKRPELESWPLAEALSRTKLPAREKLDLFLYASAHKEGRHRLAAFWGIKSLDQKQFDRLLLSAITGLPNDVTGEYWKCPEVHIAQLAMESNEPAVWQAVEKVAKRAEVGLRMQLLTQFAGKQDKRRRPERLRLM